MDSGAGRKTVRVTIFNQAYSLDKVYRVAHHGEATLPPSGNGGVARPFMIVQDSDVSQVILQEDGVTVTTFAVNHTPVFPAVGYRFDYKGRSIVISGDTEEQIAAAARETKKQIAFYASTAAYRPVLELHGWGDLQSDLAGLSRCGAWDQMSDLITDEVLDTFAVSGAPEQIPSLLQQRFGGMLDRLSLHTPYDPDSEVTARILAGLKQDVSNA